MRSSILSSLILSTVLFAGACAASEDALEPAAEQSLIEAGFTDNEVDELRLALEVEPELGVLSMGTSAANACVATYRSFSPQVLSSTSNGRVYATRRGVGFGFARFWRQKFIDTCTDACGGTVVSSYAVVSPVFPRRAVAGVTCE